MFTKKFAAVMAACLLAGCTSFRTTALYRFDNDSVAPECNKLKGLPVKLKVPSHVRVVVYEQQLLLANTPEAVTAAKGAAATTAGKVKELKGQISSLNGEVDDAGQEISDAQKELAQRQMQSTEADMLPETTQEEKDRKRDAIDIAKKSKDAAKKRIVAAQTRQTTAIEARDAKLSDLDSKLINAKRDADIAADDAVVGYTLVSFTPQQLVVETELEYTDKIFLVDFRRPAGGILDLKEASMDDEQYFAKIQAEVTERTLADVSTAIKTLQGPLTPKKSATNVATPTSADTPDGETANDVSFQKSVVAVKRFDISEPGWEDQMMAFVNQKLCSGGAPEVFQNPGYGSANSAATFEESSALLEMYPIPNVSRTAQGNY